jgi:alpha-tubulin suppressor-like RCC1 family protein
MWQTYGPNWRITKMPPLNPREAHYPFAQPTDSQLGLVFSTQQSTDSSGRQIGSHVVFASAGKTHTLVLTSIGQAFAFGKNDRGQLGLKDKKDRLRPTQVLALVNERIVKLAAGGGHSAFLDALGIVYTCGANHLGQLGLGNFVDIDAPTRVQPLLEAKLRKV